MSKVVGIFVKILAFFYDARSPNMVISLDPRSNFANFLFVLIPHLILGKVTEFLSEKALYFTS